MFNSIFELPIYLIFIGFVLLLTSGIWLPVLIRLLILLAKGIVWVICFPFKLITRKKE